MSAISARLKQFFQRLDRSHASSPSSENTPAVFTPLATQSDTAVAEAPTVALCARCRHALRRNGHKVRGGRARARV